MHTATETVEIKILGGLPVLARFTHLRPSYSVGHQGGVEDVMLYWPSRGGKLRQVPKTIYDRISARNAWGEIEATISEAR